MIEVCLLGCGGMMPLPERRLTALLYRYNGKMILIDCGEGTQIPIKMAGWGFKSIEAVCFTHYHADHIAGLPGFLLTLGNSGRKEPLTLFGPHGLKDIVHSLCIIAPELPFEIEFVEVPLMTTQTYRMGEVYINSIPVNHTMPCLSYSLVIKRPGKFDVERAKQNRIPVKYWNPLQKGETIEEGGSFFKPEMVLGSERKGIKITYSTDTRPTDELVQFCKESDILICEGMYGEKNLLPKAIENKHMIFSEAADIAAKSQSKELWLTHYSPSLQDPGLFMEETAKIFKNAVAGKDLMKKSIQYDIS